MPRTSNKPKSVYAQAEALENKIKKIEAKAKEAAEKYAAELLEPRKQLAQVLDQLRKRTEQV